MTKLEQAAQNIINYSESREASLQGWPDWEAKFDALREALASRCQTTATEQAEQEPVGYFAYDEEHDIWEELTGPNAPGATPLYAAPVRTKDPCNPLQDLTDDEIDAIEIITDRQFARAVIAADRSKNGIV